MNKKLPTIQIKGKEYVMVKDRVIEFNERCPEGSIITEIVKNDDKSVVVKATVYPDSKNQEKRFVGHSEAYREGNMGDVPVEVAETSAVGRALGMMGIGVLEGIASADEIKKATGTGKPASDKQKNMILSLAKEKGFDITEEQVAGLSTVQASQKITKLMGMKSPEKSNSQIKAEDAVTMDIGYEDIPVVDSE